MHVIWNFKAVNLWQYYVEGQRSDLITRQRSYLTKWLPFGFKMTDIWLENGRHLVTKWLTFSYKMSAIWFQNSRHFVVHRVLPPGECLVYFHFLFPDAVSTEQRFSLRPPDNAVNSGYMRTQRLPSTPEYNLLTWQLVASQICTVCMSNYSYCVLGQRNAKVVCWITRL